MKKEHLLPAAIVALAVALALNGAALLFRGQPVAIVPPATAQIPAENQARIYYLARDTYFLTASADGRTVYLWNYDYSPVDRENRIVPVLTSTVKQP